ncbi:MAG: hypothetical protein ACRDWH_00925 [Acidimicrobiia bacterium]
MSRSNPPHRYEPLVQMAREMSNGTGAPAQTHFDELLALMRGPSRLRRTGWFIERNRRILIATAGAIALWAAHLVI